LSSDEAREREELSADKAREHEVAVTTEQHACAVTGLISMANQSGAKKRMSGQRPTVLVKRGFGNIFDSADLMLLGNYRIRDDDVKEYVMQVLIPEIEKLIPATSVFGFQGFKIDRGTYADFFVTDYKRRRSFQALLQGDMEARHSEEVLKERRPDMEAKEVNLKRNVGFERLRSQDQFQEMMKACGFKILQHTIVDPANIEFRYSPVDAFIEAYRFAVKNDQQKADKKNRETNAFFRNPLTNRLKLISKCPPLLYKILKFFYATRLENSKAAKSIGDVQTLSKDEVKSRVTSEASYYFFPFSKMSYDKEKIPNLFTIFVKNGQEALEFNAKQEYLQMSKAFVHCVPEYYQWIVTEGHVF
jgi:hypothetical protein